MKLSPRMPRPHWPHRAECGEVPETPPPVGGVLRAFRVAALAAIAAVITVASAASFAESYRGLWLWARHHSLSGLWAAVFPVQVDAFIVTGELTLFVAMTDQWKKKDRTAAWAVALLGLSVSVAGNVGHVAAHDLQSRGTAAVPPLAAFVALWVGLGVLKRVIGQRTVQQETASPDAVPADAHEAAGAVCPWPRPVPVMAAPATAVMTGQPDGHEAATERPSAKAGSTASGRPRRTAATRSRNGQKRGHDRSSGDARQAAIKALRDQPDMTVADLAAVIGRSERTARRIRSEVAAANGHVPAQN